MILLGLISEESIWAHVPMTQVLNILSSSGTADEAVVRFHRFFVIYVPISGYWLENHSIRFLRISLTAASSRLGKLLALHDNKLSFVVTRVLPHRLSLNCIHSVIKSPTFFPRQSTPSDTPRQMAFQQNNPGPNWSPSMYIHRPANMPMATDDTPDGHHQSLMSVLEMNSAFLFDDHMVDTNPPVQTNAPYGFFDPPSNSQGPSYIGDQSLQPTPFNASIETFHPTQKQYPYQAYSVDNLLTQDLSHDNSRSQCLELASGLHDHVLNRDYPDLPVQPQAGGPEPIPPPPLSRGLFARNNPAAGNMLNHMINLACWFVLMGPHRNYLRANDGPSLQYLETIASNCFAFIRAAHAHTFPPYPPEKCESSKRP